MLKSIDPIQELFDIFFYSFPLDPKPPIALELLSNNMPSRALVSGASEMTINPDGISINMALAGFKEEDIKVFIDDKVLCIEGDNKHREVPDKFKSSFSRKFPVKDGVKIDQAVVKLEDGILSVDIPLTKPEERRKYLFGNK